MKKGKLKKLCDYWEGEALRHESDAAFWREQYFEATRALDALRADPLTEFTGEFRDEAIRQIDAWPSGCNNGEARPAPDGDTEPSPTGRGDTELSPAGVDDTGPDSPLGVRHG